MPKPADIGGKRLISLAPDAWVQWVTQSSEVTAREILNSEFQWVSRQNDVLVKAVSPQQGEFLILNELQLRYTSKMPRRMRAYTALAEEKYDLPTYPVLVNILPPASTIRVNDRFESDFLGLQSRQDYRLINLWEVDVSIVFDQSISTLLPFVPILQGGGEPEVVQRAVQLLRLDDSLSELEPLLGFFASFVLDTELVSQILRWDMTVLRESPWYQEIRQESLQEGEQTGIVKGKLEGEQALVLRQLTRRIGSLAPEVRSQVQALSLVQLESLGEALLDFAGARDLVRWLREN
ncbi:MAG: Rpn family recombination-promoting nuclease/putative transposase [Aphanocapsa sp. GSE-SYN-MK-11-07L]|nr:Rpn family recombination-promoting nuclease/putative transposase [Aphanocapsa sp. GSE-SYN-MK-11-07L]